MTWESQKATLVRAQADYDRAKPLVQSGAVTKEELDLRKELLAVAKARVEEGCRESTNSVSRSACRSSPRWATISPWCLPTFPKPFRRSAKRKPN